MFKDRAIALRQQVAEEIFVRLRKDRARVSAQLGPLLAYLEAHLFDPDLTVESWMFCCGIRDKGLSSRFTHELGRAPWEYVTHHRLDVAATLLMRSDLKPWRIAVVVGYSGSDAFGRTFKRWAGCSPTAYRKRGADSRRPKLVPAPLIDPQELARAIDGNLTLERAEQLHRRLNILAAQLETAYPDLRVPRAVARPVLGAELLETAIAEQLWARIRTRPLEEQRELVKSQFAFSTPAFFELLLRKSREEGRQDRQRGVEIAKLALESLEAIGGLGDQLPNFRVRAWAWIGNAHRLVYELLDAERAFTTAESEWNTILPEHRDELAVADLWFFKALLRTCRRHFDEALSLADTAVTILEHRSSSPGRLARALLSRGNILSYQERNLAALKELAKAAELTEGDGDPYLRLAIQTSAAGVNAAAGVLGDARMHIQKARSLCLQVGNKLLGFQLDWIEGILEEKAGHLESALEKILQAREGFGQLDELGYFSAASLDLALLGMKLGEIARPLVLAAEVATVFESLKFHPELLTAVRLLRNALVAQRISRDLLQQVRDLLNSLQPLDFQNLKNPR